MEFDFPKQTYSFSTRAYSFDSIIQYYYQNKIDTDLDCQRGLVWTDDQKQDLIDTIVRRERIPEFHTIKEDYESIFHFADGKQRITNSISFLTNQLKWLKSNASPEFFDIFGKRSYIYFRDLNTAWQNAILNSELQFAIYKNMTPRATTILFRKLNNGTSLSNFAKGLAQNISIKKYFLDPIMRHPVCNTIFTPKMIEKDDAELLFVRAYVLMKTYDENNKEHKNIDLTPENISQYYLDVEIASDEEIGKWIKELEKYQNIILSYLDRLNTFENTFTDSLRTTKNFPLLFAMYFTYIYNFNDKQFNKIYKDLNKKTAASIVGSGADYSVRNVQKYMNYIYHWLAMEKAA